MINFQKVKNTDEEIYKLIKEEYCRQNDGLELIASENRPSEAVLLAQASYHTLKYAEGYPGARYYGGCEVIDKTEQLAIDRVCELFGSKFANVQPHSGASANMAVQFALLRPGNLCQRTLFCELSFWSAKALFFLSHACFAEVVGFFSCHIAFEGW